MHCIYLCLLFMFHAICALCAWAGNESVTQTSQDIARPHNAPCTFRLKWRNLWRNLWRSCPLMQHLPPHVFDTIVRFLGEPHQDLPESTNRHVFSQLFSILWCSRLLADFYQYWYNWECDMAFHHWKSIITNHRRHQSQCSMPQRMASFPPDN